MREQKITVPTVGQSSGFTATQTYAYDDLNRLQSATETVSGNQTWKQTFIIDRYGNRRFDAANTTTLGSCTEAVCNPTVSTSNNRLSSSGYSFDANGNVTQDAEGKQFFYDVENHQKEVKDNLNNTIGEYFYDGQGKRVKKISTTEITIFVYNASGTLVAEYSTEIETTNAQVSYLTQDHLGSPRVITDQNGNVTSRKDYTAFGEENITSQRDENLGYSGQSEIRKGFTGYEKDDESGLDFAQARYYNASHGRYTSVDPLTASASIKNPQTFNRYSYVLNSPYKYTDPLGLLPMGSGGGCSAEYSSCDENGNGIGVDEHADRIYQTEVARLEANQAFARGDTEEGWQIIREWDFQALDQNGNVVDDPNKIETGSVQSTSTTEVSATYAVETATLSLTTSVTTVTYDIRADNTITSSETTTTTTESFVGNGSGTAQCFNKAGCAEDAAKWMNIGPTPIGNYTIVANDKRAKIRGTTGSWFQSWGRSLGVANDWGSFYFPIDRPPGRYQRTGGYYLHGGDKAGTAGCIDMGGGSYGNANTTRIVQIITSDSDGRIPLRVNAR